MATSQHRCVFVGNIPYDATEEQLIEICQEVGPVVSFRLVIDRETGKPKGYGFCEYKDEETALSARRNLQGYEINGRQLRVDFAENDKGADRNREQGRGGPGMAANVDAQKQLGGTTGPGESTQHQPIGLHIAMTAATVMSGALGGAQAAMQLNQNGMQGASMVNDPLTLHLAKLSRSQLTEIMSELKVMATQNKELARQLLLARPQLPKALFQAQIMLGMVTPQVLQMPNLRQVSGQPSQPPLQDAQQVQPSAFQSLPGLPPLAPNKVQSGFVQKLKEGQVSFMPQHSMSQNQFSTTSQPMEARIQLPQHGHNHIVQQGTLPMHSGVSMLPSVQPQTLASLSGRSQIQVANSSSLNLQTQPPLLQQPEQSGAAILGHNIRVVNPTLTLQPSQLARPSPSDAGFQPGPSKILGISQIVSKDADRSAQVHDFALPINRPSKLMKLEDGRNTSFSAGGMNASSANGSGPSRVFEASSVRETPPKVEEMQYPGKQISQSQLPPDMELALLQQVLNLTPEQLSSLPPEQQQQVIQLQKALRGNQNHPSWQRHGGDT